MRVLFVHGVLTDEHDQEYLRGVKDQVRAALGAPADGFVFEFLRYNDTFGFDTGIDDADAALRLAILSWIARRAAGMGGRTRGLFGPDPYARSAGMVVEWLTRPAVRQAAAQRLHDALVANPPDVVVAHSLGSLIAYDVLADIDVRVRPVRLITLGSQLNSDFIASAIGGQLRVPHNVSAWLNLYNESDPVFVSPFGTLAPRPQFEEFTFDSGHVDLFLKGHYIEGYLEHPSVIAEVTEWITTNPRSGALGSRPGARSLARPTRRTARLPRRRALLVGINEYPSAPLGGCVNDAWRMSQALQQNGFEADDIRLLLDGRATAAAIRERLSWLLDDARPGDRIFFGFSGHGTQLTDYAGADAPSQRHETLVPVDFDWTTERAIRDVDLAERYRNLPYETQVVLFLDCCHSGGMSRGPGARVRGLSAPDDIRHRAVRWDSVAQMWVPRSLPPLLESADGVDVARWAGDGVTHRLGRDIVARRTMRPAESTIEHRFGVLGPYAPIVLTACQADQLAEEYTHGGTSYGAFTYAFAHRLDGRQRLRTPTFASALRSTGRLLGKIGYAQRPEVFGPTQATETAAAWPRFWSHE